jgi:hypothetical protein
MLGGWQFNWDIGRRRPGWTLNSDGRALDGYIFYVAEEKKWKARAKDQETMSPIRADFDHAHEAMGFVQTMLGVQR